MIRVLAVVVAVVGLAGCGSVDRQADDTARKVSGDRSTGKPTYDCWKVAAEVRVDGNLDEPCWRGKPVFALAGIADGSPPAYLTTIRMIWNDEYLYLGARIADPDVWSRAGLRDAECGREFAERASSHRRSKNPEFHRFEADIMTYDRFVKFILDPDGDERDYIEFHVNPINNVFDASWPQGFRKKWGDRKLKPNVVWSLPGLVTATQVDGTLNAPHDVDKGWSLEMALPWKSLAAFTKGACPPKVGEAWTAHLGRIHQKAPRSGKIYWTWPVIGQVNCHLPHTYGRVVFADESGKVPAHP